MKTTIIKSIAILVLLIFSSVILRAENKWDIKVSLDPIITNFKHFDNLQVSVGVNREVHKDISVGVAVGVLEDWKFKGNPYVPVLADFNAQFLETVVRPTFDLRAGYEFSTKGNKEVGNGFVINPMVGGRYKDMELSHGYLGIIGTTAGSEFTSTMAVRLSYYFGL